MTYPRGELPRLIREALCGLTPPDDVRTTTWITEAVDEPDGNSVRGALHRMASAGLVERCGDPVQAKTIGFVQSWRATSLARGAPASVTITRSQARLLAAFHALGGAATVGDVAAVMKCSRDWASRRLRHARQRELIAVQGSRYVVAAP